MQTLVAFPQRFLDELVDRSDIVDVVSSYVSLSKKGGNYFGLCPFHILARFARKRTALGKSRFSISMTNWITPPPW